MLVANATGCSSIYGGNLPTTPWSANAAGRGPAWSNSLFEDNAEFGFGMRVAIDQQRQMALELLERLGPPAEPLADPLLPEALVAAIREADQQRRGGHHGPAPAGGGAQASAAAAPSRRSPAAEPPDCWIWPMPW